ncbi:MAG: MlaE family lipid ABC transporter permease subunit [Planctomycetota bacterium]
MQAVGYSLERQDGRALVLQGELRLADGERFRNELAALAAPSAETLHLDVSRLAELEGGAAALLLAARGEWRALGGELVIDGANERVRRLLDLYGCPGETVRLRDDPERVGLFEGIGNATLELVRMSKDGLAFLGAFSWSTIAVLRQPQTIHWRSVTGLIERAGANGVPVVLLINFLIGLIMALQSAAQLERFGAQRFVASLVGLSMTRELAPLMTAIVVAGRSGAAYAAELGTMKVSEEIDAVRTLGLDPLRYLVFPRVLAMILVVPLLTLVADAVSILGGLFVATTRLGLAPELYWNELAESVGSVDVIVGLVKSVFFAAAITLIACQRGLATRGGAAGVGAATTSSVVTTLIALIVIDAIATVVFEVFGL